MSIALLAMTMVLYAIYYRVADIARMMGAEGHGQGRQRDAVILHRVRLPVVVGSDPYRVLRRFRVAKIVNSRGSG
jgi:hypothetical protein